MHKLAGFDFLRAIFSIAIVADHTGLFTLATIQGSSTITNLLYVNFSYIAVPVFLQISLLLFYLKSKRGSLWILFKHRITRLLYLYFAWVVSFGLLRIFLTEGSAGIAKLATLSTREWSESIVSGGNSPFYFFFSLIFVTNLAALFAWICKKIGNKSSVVTTTSYLLLGICGIAIFTCSIVNLLPIDIYRNGRIDPLVSRAINIIQWNYNPLNFLPYIFTAAIVADEFDRGELTSMTPELKFKLWSLFCLFLTFTLLEWSLLDRLMHYSRLSLVFGSWLLLDLALLSTRTVPTPVRFISEHSLGLYALHLFFTHIILASQPNSLSFLSDLIPGLNILIEFLLVICGALMLTFLMKKIGWLKSLV
jgi:Acyltransferase family